jgi:hypothetical protein
LRFWTGWPSDQIDAFQQVLTAMRKQLDAMAPEERQEIEEASAVLRKAGASRERTTLPLTVVDRRSRDSEDEHTQPDPSAGPEGGPPRGSRAKRARVLGAIRSLQHNGDKITHAAVARTAGVSPWLTYAGGVREHVEAAIREQAGPRPSTRNSPASTTSLRVDLNWPVRRSASSVPSDQLQRNARLRLGQQLDQVGAGELTARIHELTTGKAEVEVLLSAKTIEADGLARRVTEREDELTAARTSLRQMIRDHSKGPSSPSSGTRDK